MEQPVEPVIAIGVPAWTGIPTLWNENVREMAVADGIVTMTKSNEIARTFVIADAFYNTIKYGITRFIVGTQVNTVMKLSLGSEWVIAVAIW